jgi:hypothetical protein
MSTYAKYRRDCRHLYCVVMLWAGRRSVGLLQIGSPRLHLGGVALLQIGSPRLHLGGVALLQIGSRRLNLGGVALLEIGSRRPMPSTVMRAASSSNSPAGGLLTAGFQSGTTRSGSAAASIHYVVHPRGKDGDIFSVERRDEAGVQRPHDVVCRVVGDMLQVFQLSG